MGHGDEVVLADAHFPASSVAKSSACKTLEIRADCCDSLTNMLEAIVNNITYCVQILLINSFIFELAKIFSIGSI